MKEKVYIRYHPVYFSNNRKRLNVSLLITYRISVLSRQIHIECQSKHNYVYVIYKVLVYVQTPCILHKHSCILTDILYEFVYLVLRYTTGMALLKIESLYQCRCLNSKVRAENFHDAQRQ